MQNGGSQQKGAGSQLWGAGSVIRGSGSQTSGAGSEIQWDPPNLTPVIISGTVTFITQPDDAEVWSGPKRTVETLSQT